MQINFWKVKCTICSKSYKKKFWLVKKIDFSIIIKIIFFCFAMLKFLEALLDIYDNFKPLVITVSVN